MSACTHFNANLQLAQVSPSSHKNFDNVVKDAFGRIFFGPIGGGGVGGGECEFGELHEKARSVFWGF